MKCDFTNETVFSFEGPNLCLLGDEKDFRKLSESILELTDISKTYSIQLTGLDFIENVGIEKNIFFESKENSMEFGVLNEKKDLLFKLDHRVWERLFRYFVLMSWYKRTYYLNSYESYLQYFSLEQECNFICSSSY